MTIPKKRAAVTPTKTRDGIAASTRADLRISDLAALHTTASHESPLPPRAQRAEDDAAMRRLIGVADDHDGGALDLTICRALTTVTP